MKKVLVHLLKSDIDIKDFTVVKEKYGFRNHDEKNMKRGIQRSVCGYIEVEQYI